VLKNILERDIQKITELYNQIKSKDLTLSTDPVKINGLMDDLKAQLNEETQQIEQLNHSFESIQAKLSSLCKPQDKYSDLSSQITQSLANTYPTNSNSLLIPTLVTTSKNSANTVQSAKIEVMTTAQGVQPSNVAQNVQSNSTKLEVSSTQQAKPVVTPATIPSPTTVHEVWVQKSDVPVVSRAYPAFIPNPMVQMPPQPST